MRGTQLRMQSAVEFLTTYAWSFIILAIMVAVVGSFLVTKSPTTYIPATCYISPEFICQTMVIASSSGSAHAQVVFINDLGAQLQFPSTNSFTVSTAFSTNSYRGACEPYNAPIGAPVDCNATIPNYVPPVGTQVSLAFTTTYKICAKKCSASATYNTSGDGVVYTSPIIGGSGQTSATQIYLVSLASSPSTDGNITLQGITYPSGSNAAMVTNVVYSIYARPQSGHVFYSWSSTNIVAGDIVIANALAQSTTVTITGPGTIKASFN